VSRCSWLSAVGLALSAAYLPTLLPLAVGPLRNSADQLSSYLRTLPVRPGFAPGALLTQPLGVPLPVGAGIFTALILASMLVIARRRYIDDALAVAAALALIVGVESFFLGVALRA